MSPRLLLYGLTAMLYYAMQWPKVHRHFDGALNIPSPFNIGLRLLGIAVGLSTNVLLIVEMGQMFDTTRLYALALTIPGDLAMVLTPSTMLPLGTSAPDFSLINVDSHTVSLDDFADAPALLVIFMCNHCPYVIHVADQLALLAREYMARGVAVVGINSNDVANYPADSPEQMVAEAEARGYGFPYLYDETQEVARAYQAACTPDFFLFDADRKLVYRGQLDASRPESGVPVTGADLRAALDTVLAGDTPSEDQTPSIGCNIKWKPENSAM